MEEQRKPTPKVRKGLHREGRRTGRRRRELRDLQGSEAKQLDQEGNWSSGERFMVEKVHELFQECGGAERGFITRDDMQKLQNKFSFSPEELEVVFDKLDVDRNGCLTPEKLTRGLSHFLTDQSQEEDDPSSQNVSEFCYQSQSLQQEVEVEDEEKQHFAALMERLGASTILEDKLEIWKLWVQLRRNEPNLLGNLEDFVSKVTVQLQEAQSEKKDLERTLKKRMMEHNAEVQRLYEEMELQINNEKERIESENIVRLHAQSQDLQKEIDSKQEEVQHLVQTRTQLQAELVSLHNKQDESITENEKLKLTNQELETQLEQIQQELQEAQDRLLGQQEEAAQREEKEAQREEKEGERDQSPSNEGLRSDEADPQKEARQRWGSDTSQGDVRSEGLRRNHRNSGHQSRIISIEEEPLLQQALQHSEVQSSKVIGQEIDLGTVKDGDAVFEEKAEPSWNDKAADPTEEAELVSQRSKQDEAITEIERLKLTNQELEMRLEQIQQEFQEAQDRLVGQQEEAAQREEKEGERDQSPGSEGRRSDETDPQDEAITEIERLKLTNQELEMRLEQIQQEFQEAQDRLVGQQEEAAQREEKERERDQSPSSEGWRSDEADPQLQAELVSLRIKQDEAITEIERLKLTNQELEMRLEQIQQEFQEAQDRLVGQQEEAAQREEKEGERDQSPGSEGRRSDADPQLQAELVSLRNKQDEAITEIERLKLTNQELEMRLEQIQQEFQEAQDRLVGQQEEAAQREEKEGEWDQSPGSEGRRSDETDPQLQAELVSLCIKQDEAITEIERLKLTNQELEMRLEQILQEFQEAQDRLVGQQEEAAQREEKEREQDQSSGSEERRSDEADPQLQAELVSLRSKQDEAITEMERLKLTNQELEMQLEQIQHELQEAKDQLLGQQEEAAQREEKEGLQRTRSIRRRVTRNASSKPDPLGEDSGLPHLRVEGQEVTVGTGGDGDGACEETTTTSARDETAERVKELQAELVSLRSKEDETITENHKLKLTNQELEMRLEQIQQEFQEAQDRLVGQQEEAAQREEKERERDQTPGSEERRSDEADAQLQAELVSLHSKQDEAITEMERLKLTNQELEMRLEQIQQEFQEAQDRLVGQQEEAAQREEKEGEQDQSSGSEERRSDEADPQLQAELVSVRSKQDEAITEMERLKLTNQELEMQLEQIQQELQEAKDRLVGQQEEAAQREEKEGLQRTRSIRRRVTRNASSKPDPLGEDSGLPHLRVEGQEVTVGTGGDGDGACEETTTTSARDETAERVKELQAELISLRSKEDETITENHKLKLTNQELEMRLEQIQQEFQEAQDRLVGQQEEAAQREEKERERDQSLGSEERRSDEADAQLQAELVSLRNKQDEAITEIERLKLTNQELEMRLEQIQQEFQEAQDRLVGQQEEAAQREEKEGEQDQSSGSEERRSDEADPQLQAELVSLRSKQDEAITEMERLKLTNQELEMRLEQIQQELQEAKERLVGQQEEAAQREEKEGLQRTRSIRRRVTRNASSKPDPLGEDSGLPHLRVEGLEVTVGTGGDGDGACEETTTTSRDETGERVKELQAELISLRSKEDETITENHKLKLTNQELEMRLEQIQQEAQDRLVGQQEEAAQREEKERERDQSPGREGRRSDEADPQLQAELVSLRIKQDEAIIEIERLKLTNQELEMQLEQNQQEFQEAQDWLVGQQEEAAQREEKEGLQRTRSIRRRVTHNASSKPEPLGEDSGLPHLRVEGQEVTVGTGGDGDGACEETATTSARDETAERVKELQAELVSLRSKQDETITENHKLKLTNQELEMRLEQIQQELQEAQDRLVGQQEEAAQQEEKEGLQRTRSIRRRVTHNTSNKPDPLGEDSGLPHLRVEGQEVTVGTGGGGDGACEETATTSARDETADRIKEVANTKDPDHLYNIIFVGNANAGKTSFIQRFSDDNFHLGLSATVGVDFRVKSLTVENRNIALQLWDTAGQERFRSVTKQFFRKADGVIVMYDITASSSFSEVRYWLSCVKEFAADDVAILLLGNKMDDAVHRQVLTVEGERLAQEYSILFYECSACTGHNISPPIVHLAKLLKQQEEKIKKTVVEIVKQPAKKGKCCM
ncbi:trichohyalin-like isoform X11 [Heterodontus francisci]|uniref:trichohyalin-like isoform X11 n=1 Tax=Heterodontus francisci TaxID=7792 RepID=UPI00355C9227